ncbi:MAG: segregation/condensation protein A [Tissierellia bacterium]|nr:segregation/condensation protein A [Tissierellia bacterium]
MKMNYEVDITEYHGPMDLLVHLIKKREVDIFDIPIGIIADDFLKYIEHSKTINLNIASEFLIMATSLLTIKASMLLPKLDSLDEIDPRDDLVKAILEYELINSLSDNMVSRFETQKNHLTKVREDFEDSIEINWSDIELKELIKAYRYLANMPSNTVKNNHIIRKSEESFLSIDHCSETIRKSLSDKKSIKFSVLIGKEWDKAIAISFFLAILELGRQLFLSVYIDSSENDIILTRR